MYFMIRYAHNKNNSIEVTIFDLHTERRVATETTDDETREREREREREERERREREREREERDSSDNDQIIWVIK